MNAVDILRTDETIIESCDESNIYKKENNEYLNDIITETSLVSPIDDDKYIQYDDDDYKYSINEEISYSDTMVVTSKLHSAL